MPSAYTADEQSAAKIAGGIADGPSALKVGRVTKATSSTTAVVAHGLAGTPNFILATLQADAGGPLNQPGITADSTSVTFTISTAQTAWTVAYVMGIKS